MGVDVDVEGVVDTFESGVWEPTVNKVGGCVGGWVGGWDVVRKREGEREERQGTSFSFIHPSLTHPFTHPPTPTAQCSLGGHGGGLCHPFHRRDRAVRKSLPPTSSSSSTLSLQPPPSHPPTHPPTHPLQ